MQLNVPGTRNTYLVSIFSSIFITKFTICEKNNVILSRAIDKETDRSGFETRELKEVKVATKEGKNRFQKCPLTFFPLSDDKKKQFEFFSSSGKLNELYFAKVLAVSLNGRRTKKLARFELKFKKNFFSKITRLIMHDCPEIPRKRLERNVQRPAFCKQF